MFSNVGVNDVKKVQEMYLSAQMDIDTLVSRISSLYDIFDQNTGKFGHAYLKGEMDKVESVLPKIEKQASLLIEYADELKQAVGSFVEIIQKL